MIDYFLFLLAFAASAAAPGPEIAAIVGRVLAGGMRAAIALAAGIIAGKLLMLSAALLGLAGLFAMLGPWFGVLKFLGAAYLLYLGLKKWRDAGRILEASREAGLPGRAAELFLGLAMTLSNPLAIMFYLALLPGMIDVQKADLRVFGLLCGIITLTMTVIVLAYGSLAEAARRLFSSPGSKVAIDRAAAVIMMGAAGLIACR
ncbi:LysE family translocator [Undibacterium terreum]|uniref:Lysine transporter LysE n=1 Tax=Undibacterium terreum TaxID=1224302 RepID=A0A916U6Z3_9BURK|nr:LysE family translocator [Undibacterium terreum]GGC62135.1 lysine transporter LysE [Undibacterium terreum]